MEMLADWDPFREDLIERLQSLRTGNAVVIGGRGCKRYVQLPA